MPITVSGTTITFNDSTTQTTAGKSGTVTSVATGNGLSGGTITTTGTLIIACPSFNTVGSYAFCNINNISASSIPVAGNNYSGGDSQNQLTASFLAYDPGQAFLGFRKNIALSGSWKWMGGSNSGTIAASADCLAICCRVS